MEQELFNEIKDKFISYMEKKDMTIDEQRLLMQKIDNELQTEQFDYLDGVDDEDETEEDDDLDDIDNESNDKDEQQQLNDDDVPEEDKDPVDDQVESVSEPVEDELEDPLEAEINELEQELEEVKPAAKPIPRPELNKIREKAGLKPVPPKPGRGRPPKVKTQPAQIIRPKIPIRR